MNIYMFCSKRFTSFIKR